MEPVTQRPLHSPRAAKTGEHDHLRVRDLVADAGAEGNPVGVRETHVDEHHVRPLTVRHLEGLLGRPGVPHRFHPESLERRTDRLREEFVTVDDESADFFGVVGGPGDDLEAGLVELGYVDCGVGA